MKNIVKLTLLLCLFASCKKEPVITNCGQRQYYYFAGKVSLAKQKDKLLVCFTAGTTEAGKQQVLQSYPFYGNTLYSINSPGGNWVVFSLKSFESCDKVTDNINQLKANPAVTMATQVLLYEQDGAEEGITTRFVVKLKPTATAQQLNDLALSTNTSVISQSQFDAQTYYMNADKYSKGDALDMANVFYESGIFEYAEPDIFIMSAAHQP